MVPAVVLSSVLGVVLGIVAATRAGRSTDVAISTSVLVTDSVPVFWLGQMLLLLFAVNLGVLPTQGMSSVYGGGSFDTLKHAVLPIATLTIATMASLTRVTRIAVLDALKQDYIVTARSKGVSRRRVLQRHALRNSWVPVITVIGGEFGFILTGAILTETVFGWPGVGSLFVEAINARDYPVVQGIFVFMAVTVVLANLVSDLLYAVVDPRIRKGYAR
jgi:ABC-type dipeptide/oligopeptide/nickel transport system permease component